MTRLITLVKPSATAARPTKQCVAMIGVSRGIERSSGRRCSAIWYETRSALASPPLVNEPQSVSTHPPNSVAQREPFE